MMNNISELKDCYGCGVCEIACPKSIIDLQLDNSGFYHPIIKEADKCIDCGICLKICAFNKKRNLNTENKVSVYAGWSKDTYTRKMCSTGGVAFEIVKYLVTQGYKACGVRYNVAQMRAEHFIADSFDKYLPSIGSKYLQSYTIPGFSHLKNNDKYVVIGTPCQIASLREYAKMRKIENNFLLIDFFCHGVPSMNMWRKYLTHVSKLAKIKPQEVAWRNKENGWHDSWVMSFKSNDGKNYSFTSNMRAGDLFYEMFLYNRCLNKPCYSSCKYKMANSSADIRVGDLWGKHYANEDAGVNGILAITSRGHEIINSINTIELVEESLDVVLEGQMKKGPKRDYIAMMDSLLLKTPLSLSSISKINRIVPTIMSPLLWLRGKLKHRQI